MALASLCANRQRQLRRRVRPNLEERLPVSPDTDWRCKPSVANPAYGQTHFTERSGIGGLETRKSPEASFEEGLADFSLKLSSNLSPVDGFRQPVLQDVSSLELFIECLCKFRTRRSLVQIHIRDSSCSGFVVAVGEECYDLLILESALNVLHSFSKGLNGLLIVRLNIVEQLLERPIEQCTVVVPED